MRTFTFIFVIAIATITANTQTKYELTMLKSLEDFRKGGTNEEKKLNAAQFERIAATETKEWLPLYYSSLIHCLIAFNTAEINEKQKLIDHAQEQVDKAIMISENESELHTLQGMIYQAQITVDPMNYGPLYSGKATGCFEMAKKLNPVNPRPVYLQGLSVLHTPEEYGGGKETGKPILLKALELFENYVPVSNLYPDWGKEDCEHLLNSCEIK